MALPELDPIPEAPEAPSRIEYGANKAEFRPKANLFMDWQVTFSLWLRPYLEYIQALYTSVRTDTQEIATTKNEVVVLYTDTVNTKNKVVALHADTGLMKNATMATQSEILATKNEVESSMIQAKIDLQNILNGATASLPASTIIDSTTTDSTTWSSEKLSILFGTSGNTHFPELKLF